MKLASQAPEVSSIAALGADDSMKSREHAEMIERIVHQSAGVPFDTLPDASYVRLAQLIPVPLPISAATLWRRVQDGSFPKPIKVSASVTAWKVGEIRAWLAAQGGG